MNAPPADDGTALAASSSASTFTIVEDHASKVGEGDVTLVDVYELPRFSLDNIGSDVTLNLEGVEATVTLKEDSVLCIDALYGSTCTDGQTSLPLLLSLSGTGPTEADLEDSSFAVVVSDEFVEFRVLNGDSRICVGAYAARQRNTVYRRLASHTRRRSH
jgi:hypothetical protein